jgi:TRAP-type C4-dicarboxylate transport system permease small subunit
MNGRNIVAIIFIVFGLYIGYIGINKLANNTNEIKFLGIEIDASNEKGQTQGVVFIVLAAMMIGGGAALMRKK